MAFSSYSLSMTARCWTLSLILFAAFSSAAFSLEVVISGDATAFREPGELTKIEWERAVPAAVRQGRAPAYLYTDSLATSRQLYLGVTNRGPHSFWYLEFPEQLELVELHYYSPSRGAWLSSYAGDQVPMAERALPHNRLLLPLNIQPGERLELYIRAQDYQNKNVRLRFLEPAAFLMEMGRVAVLDLFAFCLILVLLLYILFHFRSGKEIYNLFYAVSMLCLVVTLLGKYRYWSYLFTPERPYGYFIYIFFNTLAAMAALGFAGSFFRVRGKTPLFALFTALLLGLGGIALWSLFDATPRLGDVMNMVIIPALLLILGLALKSGFSGDRASRMVVFSIVPFILGAVGENMMMYLSIDTFSPDRMMLAGTALHILLMNYSMVLRREDQERDYRKLKAEFSRSVEQGVQARTRKLEADVQTDPLTGVMNRAGMEKKMAELERTASGALGILFADLDNFKHYNDTCGHKAGDQILRQTADFLKGNLRTHDLVFRYGGDEFLILMPDTPPDQAESLGQRLYEEFKHLAGAMNREWGVEKTYLGLTLGFAVWRPGHSLTEAVNAADQAMMEAKRRRERQPR